MSQTSIYRPRRHRACLIEVCIVAQGSDVRRSPSICPRTISRQLNSNGSHDLFDEYTRRQYVAKAPDRNPFGTDESPAKFNDFDALLKVRLLLFSLPPSAYDS